MLSKKSGFRGRAVSAHDVPCRVRRVGLGGTAPPKDSTRPARPIHRATVARRSPALRGTAARMPQTLPSSHSSWPARWLRRWWMARAARAPKPLLQSRYYLSGKDTPDRSIGIDCMVYVPSSRVPLLDSHVKDHIILLPVLAFVFPQAGVTCGKGKGMSLQFGLS